jgi:hypothetical protein
MKLGEFDYKISRQVEFTKKELDLLLRMARGHYDFICQDAASVANAPGRKNGFLTVATLFKGQHFWTFDKFDITAKILEQRHLPPYVKDLKLTTSLFMKMMEAMDSINDEYTLLMGSQKQVTKVSENKRSKL